LEDHNFLLQIGMVLAAALLGGLAARALRIPVIIGYLIAGLAVGRHTPGFVADAKAVDSIANMGVVLLMFAVGVQFSLKELTAVKKTALIAGTIQITGVIGLGLLVAGLMHWGLYGGLFVGCAMALSSTAVMIRILEERGELGTTHGTIMMGISVVQDFSVIVMIALLPALASTGAGFSLLGVGLALLRAVAFIGVTVLLSMRVVPALMHRVARTGSPELFVLTSVCLCFLAAVAAELSGLGLALGAFIAGIVISETDYAHEVFSQVRPMRDVFASLFFVSIGMLLDPVFIAHHAAAVTAVVLAIIVGKAIVTAIGLYPLGWHGRTIILVSLGMAQIGEFSFVLTSIGTSKGLIAPEISGTILSGALVSLLIAPFIYKAAGPLYTALAKNDRFAALMNRKSPMLDDESAELPATQAIILGCGRVGRYVSDSLSANGISHVVVDYDGVAIAKRKKAGAHVVYGDASSAVVLAQANPSHARMAFVSLPEAELTVMAIRALKSLAPNIEIIARVHRGEDIPVVREAGAARVVHAEFEAGAAMIREGLMEMKIGPATIDDYIATIRDRRYRDEGSGGTG
jgi:CPA2 family monovalent cation:H+ antiporter-2